MRQDKEYNSLKHIVIVALYVIEFVFYTLLAKWFGFGPSVLYMFLLTIGCSIGIYHFIRRWNYEHFPFISLEIIVSVCGLILGFDLNSRKSFPSILGIVAAFYVVLATVILLILMNGLLLSKGKRKQK